MKFFLDNCISKAMAVAIAAIGKSQGIEIVHLTEIFDAKTPDTVWIPGIKGMGFVVVSGDPRISRNPANRAAWLESELTAFFSTTDGWTRESGCRRRSSFGGGRSSWTRRKNARRGQDSCCLSKARFPDRFTRPSS